MTDFLQEVSSRLETAASPQELNVGEIAGRRELQLAGPPLIAAMADEVR